MLYPETPRFRLMPLTYDQMQLYVANDYSLEKVLGLNLTMRMIDDSFAEIIVNRILPGLAEKGDKYLYHTLWTVVLIAENRMVADISIKGEPNDAGEVEIGYGTYDAFQGRGYMTEAVGGIVNWLRTEPLVKAVIASTLKDNFASIRVLEKNGFVKTGETDDSFDWKLVL